MSAKLKIIISLFTVFQIFSLIIWWDMIFFIVSSILFFVVIVTSKRIVDVVFGISIFIIVIAFCYFTSYVSNNSILMSTKNIHSGYFEVTTSGSPRSKYSSFYYDNNYVLKDEKNSKLLVFCSMYFENCREYKTGDKFKLEYLEICSHWRCSN